MLQFGLRAHDLGRGSAEYIAQRAASHGAQSVQLALAKALSLPSATGSLSAGYARHIASIFSRHNIAIAVLGCYINPVHPDADEREKHLRRFEEHLRLARDFGCALVGTETGSLNPDCSFHPDTAKESTFDTLCRSVERLLHTAQAVNARVAIEAVAGVHTIDSIEKMSRLIARLDCPNLAVIYDPVNLIPLTGIEGSQEDFFRSALDALAHKIEAVHIKDFMMQDGKKRGDLPSGTGDLDYPSLFRLLCNKKPYIDVLLENTRPESLADTLSFVKKSLDAALSSEKGA